MGTPIWDGGQPPLVYFAEPIDKTQGRNLVVASALVTTLAGWDCTIYRPATAFKAVQPDPRVEDINRHALYQADIIVAYLDPNIPSIGVPAEIEAATSRGIPAVVHYTGTSFVLAGNRLVTQIKHTNEVVNTVQQAVKNHPRIAAEQTLTAVQPRRRISVDPGLLPDLAARDLDGEAQLFHSLVRQALEQQANPLRTVIVSDEPLRLVVTDGAPPPSRAYLDDAGIDLTVAKDRVVEPGEYADIPTQVTATQLPSGYWGMITGRSSALRKWRLHIPVAVIDPGWRGPLFVGAWNLSGVPVHVKAGDRLGQLILIPNNPTLVQTVAEVDHHPRGLNGFGSSG